MRRSPARHSKRAFRKRANRTFALNRAEPRRGGIRL